MRKLWLLLLLLGLPVSVHASWAYMSVEELVLESDVIVIGTLRDVTEHSADGRDYGEGRIDVREVIWGDVSPFDTLTLKWQNATAVACPRVEHGYNAGKEGIWLLTRDGAVVNANYPGRFVGLSERKHVERALGHSPVLLRADTYWVKPGEPMRFSVVYRNASSMPRTFPGLAFEGGSFHLSRGPELTVQVTLDSVDGRGAARLSGRVVRDKGLAPVTVPPRGEHRVEIDLREMLTTEPHEKNSYDVILKFDGLPPTNEIGFYVSEPLSLMPTPPPPAPVPKEVYVFKKPTRVGVAPLARAGLVALVALLLFPFFYKLRAALSAARLARVLQGT